jgi:Ni2+-binding GTPase involved in maturation of urease and hydrogenase
MKQVEIEIKGPVGSGKIELMLYLENCLDKIGVTTDIDYIDIGVNKNDCAKNIDILKDICKVKLKIKQTHREQYK